MGALVGLGVGLGALLIWSAFATPRTPRPVVTRPSRLERMLAEAGMGGVPVRSLLLLCGAVGLISCSVVIVGTRTPPLGVVVGVLASYLPIAVVSGRVRRRRREFAEVWPDAVDDLTSAVRAGMSLPDAVAALAVRGPEPLRPAAGWSMG